jgi:hypothetical protein
MKTHLHPIRSLALAGLAISAAASVSAQTVITPDLKAPPSAYSTSSTGMVLRAHQIYAARTPGDQNSLGNIMKQLSGGFGANQAASGPLTGGLWPELYLNHTHYPGFPAQGDGDWVDFTPNGASVLPFPGINVDTNLTAGFTTIAYEILTYLNLPAGTNTLKVGCGDAYKIYIGAGDNPYSLLAASPAQFDGSRGFAPSVFDIDVQSAGVYPVRIIFGQAGDQIGGLQFSSTNGGNNYLINDPSGLGLTSYQPAVLPIPAPSLAYVSLLAPVPGETGVNPKPTVRVQLTDGTTTTVTNVSTLTFDGVPVSPTVTKTGSVTYVTYAVPNLLSNLSVHTNQVVAQDSAGNVLSNQWTFTVGTFTVVPASWAYAAGSGDVTQPGFAGRVHQTREAANGSPTIQYGNAQIEGQLIDGATGLPYVNTVVTNGDPIIGAGWTGTQPAEAGGGPGDARTFTVTSNINYSIADGFGSVMDTGNFNSANGQPDALFPGLPGSIDDTFVNYINSGEFAVELVAFLELPAGLQQIGVNCNDGFQLAISPNSARDIFRQELISNENTRAAVDSVATVFVETNGVYSFRLMQRLYRDTAASSLEWFNVDQANATRLLINDTNAAAVKSYRALTVPTRAYVKSVSPAKDASGVLPFAPIIVVLENATNTTPVLKVKGNTVSYTATTNGSQVTLTHTPPAALSGNVNCEIQYGGLTGQWSYTVKSGRQVLWITGGSTASGGDVPLVNRLATKYGLDVQVVAQSALEYDRTNEVAPLALTSNKVLIAVSSQVSGGTVAPWARSCILSNISVPVITWEQANGDDWAFTEGTTGPAVGGTTHIALSNGPVYLHAGFANGEVVVTHTGAGGGMSCSAAPGTILAGYFTNAPNPALVGVPNGLVVTSTAFGSVPITHASRKVFFGLVNNNSAQELNADGMKFWDAAIEWLLPPTLTGVKGPGAGQLTLSWTGEGTLVTTTSLTPPVSWADAPSQANPQTVNTTDAQRYYRVKQ